MARREFAPFIWTRQSANKFQVHRLVVGQETGYRPFCDCPSQAVAQQIVEKFTPDGAERV